MQAVVLEKVNEISIREIEVYEEVGPTDVKIQPTCVGICGSDVHYYKHGRIGNFVLREPMVLGHEASGVVTEVGSEVDDLTVGDRVCMEPGIPTPGSDEERRGMYHLDPSVRFWATPPIHGCMREEVVHPASFTYRLPENVSFEEGALVEPLAIGVHSAKTAKIVPGDVAIVLGCGTIGIVTALAALAAGCSHVVITDIKQEKLDFVKNHYGKNITTCNSATENLQKKVREVTRNGAHVLFEATGSSNMLDGAPGLLAAGGRMVLIGMPSEPASLDVVSLQVKELKIYSIFRYANVFDRTLDFISSGQMNVKPLVTHRYGFWDSKTAFDFASNAPGDAVKVQVDMSHI